MRNPDDPIASTEPPTEGQSFYGRWSRRKRQARDGVVPVDEAQIPNAVPTEPDPGNPPAARAEPPAADEAKAEAPVLTDADMPPLESLGEDDDYSGFMSPGVSEALRNRALRKLFMSSQYNVVDGLDDYADDFTNFEPLGDIITSDMRHQMELQAERAKLEAEEKARAMLDEDTGPREEAGAAEQTGADGSVDEDEPSPNPDGAIAALEPAAAPDAMPDEDPEEPRDV